MHGSSETFLLRIFLYFIHVLVLWSPSWYLRCSTSFSCLCLDWRQLRFLLGETGLTLRYSSRFKLEITALYLTQGSQLTWLAIMIWQFPFSNASNIVFMSQMLLEVILQLLDIHIWLQPKDFLSNQGILPLDLLQLLLSIVVVKTLACLVLDRDAQWVSWPLSRPTGSSHPRFLSWNLYKSFQ